MGIENADFAGEGRNPRIRIAHQAPQFGPGAVHLACAAGSASSTGAECSSSGRSASTSAGGKPSIGGKRDENRGANRRRGWARGTDTTSKLVERTAFGQVEAFPPALRNSISDEKFEGRDPSVIWCQLARKLNIVPFLVAVKRSAVGQQGIA
jgi:hypothetical protein